MKRRAGDKTEMKDLSDQDLLVHWAAEEFVAAGRAPTAAERDLHRRRAAFFGDILHEMRGVPPKPEPPTRMPLLGRLLGRAFKSGVRKSS